MKTTKIEIVITQNTDVYRSYIDSVQDGLERIKSGYSEYRFNRLLDHYVTINEVEFDRNDEVTNSRNLGGFRLSNSEVYTALLDETEATEEEGVFEEMRLDDLITARADLEAIFAGLTKTQKK